MVPGSPFCLHTAEVTGSIPVAPTAGIPCGHWVSLGQSPSLVAVPVAPRPRRGHIRIVPGWVEGVGGVAVETFVEVPVDVEDGFDAGVSEPGGDDGGVGALGDQQCDVAVAKVAASIGGRPERMALRIEEASAGWGKEPPGSSQPHPSRPQSRRRRSWRWCRRGRGARG